MNADYSLFPRLGTYNNVAFSGIQLNLARVVADTQCKGEHSFFAVYLILTLPSSGWAW